MKKVLLLAAVILGTTVMVNAQEVAKTTPAKEVKSTKHHKKTDKKATTAKADVKATDATKPAAKK